jgi:hypothetical protein
MPEIVVVFTVKATALDQSPDCRESLRILELDNPLVMSSDRPPVYQGRSSSMFTV